ncbi:MAG: ectoine/hydroxyectoine ABC transporter permease subunit EhuD [Mesorhizobium sp.]|nr:ectoine/hydroxyectoine ABC transporter permease subunit EhuD [Mesorhizobium sp.]
MNFDFDYALQILPTLLRATVITFQATVGGMVLAMIVGLALELLRRSGVKPVVYATKGFVSFVRGTPLLIQLYFLYYVLPLYGLSLETMETGILGLGLHYGAYLSEVYRAGIDGVPKGQWEAATALNASRTHTWLRIILPQAVPPRLPVFGNYLIAMFKDTPLLATITLLELLGTAQAEAAISYRYLEPYTLVGLIFLVLSWPSASLVRLIENRIRAENRNGR